MREFGNQYVSTRNASPLESVFEKFGARGIKKAQQEAMPSPIAKLAPSKASGIVEGEHDAYNDYMKDSLGDTNRIIEILMGIFNKRDGLLGILEDQKVLRSKLVPDSPIRRALGGFND